MSALDWRSLRRRVVLSAGDAQCGATRQRPHDDFRPSCVFLAGHDGPHQDHEGFTEGPWKMGRPVLAPPITHLEIAGVGSDIFETFFPAAALRKVPELVTAPTTASRKSFSELRAGWRELTQWGAAPPWPLEPSAASIHDDVVRAITPQVESWFNFRKNWETGKQDTTALEAQSIDLEVAKNRAAEFGYPGEYHERRDTDARPGTDTKVHKPAIEDQTYGLKAASETKEAADAASKAAGDVGDQLKKIPWGYKAGAVALVAGVVILAVRSVVR